MSRTTEHNGCRLAYDVRGDGPPVLFIQGVGVHGAGWQPQVDTLAARYTCLMFDNRGMGHSQPAAPALSVEMMADDARAIMDAEEWPAAHVVGHSLGGLVALHLALAHPKRVRSLSLLCTFASGRAAAPLTFRMMWAGMRFRIGTRRMRRRGFLQLVLPPRTPGVNRDELAEQLVPLFGHDLADQPPVVSAQLQAMRGADVTPRLRELAAIPTLVVSATHDPIAAPPHLGRVLAAGIPCAKFVEIADASHGVPILDAGRINGLLLEHLAAADRT